MITEFVPIIILIFIVAFCIAAAIILAIRSRKSLLNIDEKDFIDTAIEKKRRSLNANVGGMKWKDYVMFLVTFPTCLGFLSYIMLDNKAFCIIFVIVGLFIPELMVRMTVKKQKKTFEVRYARALRILASSLNSGRSINQSIDDVGKSPFVDEHIRQGFRQISSDIKVGIPLETAFRRFADESGSVDAKDVAIAISMQAKVGGSEAKVINTIAQNINQRILTRKEVKALFADTDILVLVLDFAPLLFFLFLYSVAPSLMQPVIDSPPYFVAMIALLVFSTIGSFVIHKLISTAKKG